MQGVYKASQFYPLPIPYRSNWGHKITVVFITVTLTLSIFKFSGMLCFCQQKGFSSFFFLQQSICFHLDITQVICK